MAQFEESMQEQRDRAKRASRFDAVASDSPTVNVDVTFSGYHTLTDDSEIVAIIADGDEKNSVRAGERATLVLAATPFYAESGGQIGDQGTLKAALGSFAVEDTQYLSGKVIGHIGCVEEGELQLGERVVATVDAAKRRAIMNNHSATHLLHAALMNTLGSHVQQKGSLVAADRLRFDFAHDSAVSAAELQQIETDVNDAIRNNWPVTGEWMELEEAKSRGAQALFGEKYDASVRVIRMGDYSLELCGGTHVERTGDIGLFKIIDESSIASGIRRIEALTGVGAVERMQWEANTLAGLAHTLHTGLSDIQDSVNQIVKNNRLFERQISDLKTQLATGASSGGGLSVTSVEGIPLHISRHDGIEVRDLRKIMATLQQQIETGVIVLGSVNNGKATLMCSVSEDLLSRLHAGNIIREISPLVGGQGGGKPHLAQGGGADGNKIDVALEAVAKAIA